MLKTQLNIDAVKKVAELSEVISENSSVEVKFFLNESKDEAHEIAKRISEELGLQIFEGEYQNMVGGWFQLMKDRYKSPVEITLHYSGKDV